MDTAVKPASAYELLNRILSLLHECDPNLEDITSPEQVDGHKFDASKIIQSGSVMYQGDQQDYLITVTRIPWTEG
jgi:hypothetical protein